MFIVTSQNGNESDIILFAFRREQIANPDRGTCCRGYSWFSCCLLNTIYDPLLPVSLLVFSTSYATVYLPSSSIFADAWQVVSQGIDNKELVAGILHNASDDEQTRLNITDIDLLRGFLGNMHLKHCLEVMHFISRSRMKFPVSLFPLIVIVVRVKHNLSALVCQISKKENQVGCKSRTSQYLILSILWQASFTDKAWDLYALC